ncbi:carbonic anhydrase [Penicillium canariense]|uniref:Carbonic anhydrase n=1 Tax=Penicillium canariense TaxID=189055 RepID=A0A9W9HPB8_9EURO|nr:carbonic anhydrase [Penicillium canariense]KAJ5153002.1 carbonic anhydrase [Penicillium canariense]
MLYRQALSIGRRPITFSPKIKMPIPMFQSTAIHPLPRQTEGSERVSNYSTKAVDANFIPSLHSSKKQILWIGCSDSDCKETTILNLLPDEMLEHRNLGNMVIDGDLSCETSVRHAVVDLQVKHIIVCGHYGCGIVKATSRSGLPGPWLSKLDHLHAKHQHDIDQLPAVDRDSAFVELNILDQLRSLRNISEVADATRQGRLDIHGIVYDPTIGKALSLNEAAAEP